MRVCSKFLSCDERKLSPAANQTRNSRDGFIPLYSSDGNLRSLKENNSKGWKMKYDNQSLNTMINISSEQMYERSKKPLMIFGKEKYKVYYLRLYYFLRIFHKILHPFFVDHQLWFLIQYREQLVSFLFLTLMVILVVRKEWEMFSKVLQRIV